ncbi:MAG: DUF6115 domain-containing protein [Lachnospiraceae bacterium]
MGVLETVLILIGVVLVIGSYFVSDKLSQRDVEKIADLSEAELRVIVEKQIAQARSRIEDATQEVLEETSGKAERFMEKESNEKIMAISEYSDTVLESINKTHNEVMFLYSMLNDKYEELTNYANHLSSLKGQIDDCSREVLDAVNQRKEMEETSKEEVVLLAEETLPKEDREESIYHKDQILACYREGMTDVQIARQLGLGIGAVRLIIELYKGTTV